MLCFIEYVLTMVWNQDTFKSLLRSLSFLRPSLAQTFPQTCQQMESCRRSEPAGTGLCCGAEGLCSSSASLFGRLTPLTAASQNHSSCLTNTFVCVRSHYTRRRGRQMDRVDVDDARVW